MSKDTNGSRPKRGDGDGFLMDSLAACALQLPGYWRTRRMIRKAAKTVGLVGETTVVLWCNRPQDEEEIFSRGVEPNKGDYKQVRTWLQPFLDRKGLQCVRLDLEAVNDIFSGAVMVRIQVKPKKR